MHYPKNLGAATTYSASVVDCEKKFIFEKTNKWEKIQENDKSKKCFYDQFHSPQHQHQKTQQDQAKEKHNTKSQTQESVWGTWRFTELSSDVKSVGKPESVPTAHG